MWVVGPWLRLRVRVSMKERDAWSHILIDPSVAAVRSTERSGAEATMEIDDWCASRTCLRERKHSDSWWEAAEAAEAAEIEKDE